MMPGSERSSEGTTTESFLRLNYADLIAEYDRRLEAIERGFGMEAEFLGTWVPDDDHNKSLLYLFEAASAGGLPGLALVLDQALLDAIDGEGLLRALKPLGGVRVVRGDGHVTLEVAFKGPASGGEGLDEIPGLSTLHRAYRDMLVRETRTPRHTLNGDGRGEPGPGIRVYEAPYEGGTVQFGVDPQTHIVRAMRYTALKDGVRARMLEMLCRLMEGAPIQEVAEHGVIRLENTLRDPLKPPPVRGLITPETAGPHFAALNQLVRRFFRQYREETGVAPQRNCAEYPVSQAWRALSDEQRMARIRQGLASCPNLPAVTVHLEKLVNTQLYLTFEGCESERRKCDVIRRLERHLKSTVEPKIELYLPTAQDRLKRDVGNDLMRKPQEATP